MQETFNISSVDDLFARADSQSEKVSVEFKQTIKLYYIVRYFVSLYEAHSKQLPIQVWNEYRNAFDHFARHLTNKEKNHLKKLEGHIQRAALDVCKFLCLYFDDDIDVKLKNYTIEVLNLVDNGSFLTSIQKSHEEAKNNLKEAKQMDSKLGDDATANSEILRKYSESVFLFLKTEGEFSNNVKEINRAKYNHKMLKKTGLRENILIAIVSAVVGSFLTWLFT